MVKIRKGAHTEHEPTHFDTTYLHDLQTGLHSIDFLVQQETSLKIPTIATHHLSSFHRTGELFLVLIFATVG